MIKLDQRYRIDLRRFPFVSLPQALSLARVATALFFAIHAIVRIANGSIPRFAAFMEGVGFPNGVATVWLITIAELVAATMMITRIHVRVAAAVLMTVAVGGIVLIHRHFGWFVGEHGTGGSEFSVALVVLLLTVSAADDKTLPEIKRQRASKAKVSRPDGLFTL